jgi:hypothetical protein
MWNEMCDTVTNIYTSRLRTGLRLQQPTGMWTNAFGYDAAKRLTSVTSPAGTFTYTLGDNAPASALIKKLLLPNTSYITNTYDEVARMLSTTLTACAPAAIISSTKQSLDCVANPEDSFRMVAVTHP